MTHKRTLAKTVAYRAGSFALAMVVNAILLQDLWLAFNVSWMLVVVFSGYYYGFERAWARWHAPRGESNDGFYEE